MTLTSINDLQTWFNSNQKDDKKASHWTMYGGNYGEKETRLMANNRVDEPDKSLEFLVSSIRMLNNPKGTKFRIQIYYPGAANNPVANVYVQVFDDGSVQAPMPNGYGAVAGIGSLPGGMNYDNLVQDKVTLALLKAENEQLKNGVAQQESMWERIFGYINENEHISAALGSLITGLALKMDPAMAGMLPAMLPAPKPVTGTPAPAPGHGQADQADNPEDPNLQFINNINAVSTTLGIDPVSMSQALRRLTEANPEMARGLLSQSLSQV